MTSQSMLPRLLAATIAVIAPAVALTPAEQADEFLSRGAAAEARGETDVARNCYELALRTLPGHRATRDKLEALGRKRADELVAQGSAAEAKGDLQTANLDYVLALQSSPGHADAGKKVEALKKKMGPAFKDAGELILREKLRSIVIPRIDFEDTTVEEAIDFLRIRSTELDAAEPDPAKKGVNLVIRKIRNGEGDADPGLLRIKELKVRNTPLEVALKYICDQTRLRYKVDQWAVTLASREEFETVARTFPVTKGLLAKLGAGDGSSGQLRLVLEKHGIKLPASAPLRLEGNQFHVEAGASELKKLGELIAALGKDAPPATPQATAPPAGSLPVWESHDGKKIQAAFIRLEGDAVVVRAADGKEPKIPFSRLSPPSVAQAKSFGAVSADVLLHYDFSDGSGATVADRSGKGNHGQLAGFADTAAGAGDTSLSGWTRSKSLRLDGQDDRVETPFVPLDLMAGSFTIEAIASCSDIRRTWSPIIGSAAGNFRDVSVLQLGKVNSGNWNAPGSGLIGRASWLKDGIWSSPRPTGMGDGKLHHFALVHDIESGTFSIRFDHVLYHSIPTVAMPALDPFAAASPAPADRTSMPKMVIGANFWNAMERWCGLISEVRITKRALPPEHFLPNPNPRSAAVPRPRHRYSFSGNLEDSIGSAHGKLVDAGEPSTAFADGQLDLSANRGERSGSLANDAFVDLPNGVIAGLGNRLSIEIWCTQTEWASHAGMFRFERSGTEGEAAANRAPTYAAIGLQQKSFGHDLVGLLDVVNKGWYVNAGFDLHSRAEHHFVMVLDSADTTAGPGGTQSLYLDGYPAARAQMPPGFLDAYGDNNCWLGRGSSGDPMFKGRYNEFRIYDKALMPDEVLASHLAGPDAVIGGR